MVSKKQKTPDEIIAEVCSCNNRKKEIDKMIDEIIKKKQKSIFKKIVNSIISILFTIFIVLLLIKGIIWVWPF